MTRWRSGHVWITLRLEQAGGALVVVEPVVALRPVVAAAVDAGCPVVTVADPVCRPDEAQPVAATSDKARSAASGPLGVTSA
jgi:ABC-type sugar transport system substrate-binding protein